MKCPFRIYGDKTDFVHAHTSHIRENFPECLGEECAAYYPGGCLRLIPPALEIGYSPLRMRSDLTEDDVKKFREEVSKALPTLVPPGEVPW